MATGGRTSGWATTGLWLMKPPATWARGRFFSGSAFSMIMLSRMSKSSGFLACGACAPPGAPIMNPIGMAPVAAAISRIFPFSSRAATTSWLAAFTVPLDPAGWASDQAPLSTLRSWMSTSSYFNPISAATQWR